MYAIIETGGKQYRVSAGQMIEVERLPAAIGQMVEIDKVLLLADNGKPVVGTPTVEGARVRATVVEQGRRRKVIVFKFQSGNRYHRKLGHRQGYTRLLIEDILPAKAGEKVAARGAKVKKRKGAREKETVEAVDAPIDELALPSRVVSTLKDAGLRTVGDLQDADEDQLLAIRGFGAKSLEAVRAALEARGLILG